MVIAKKVLYLLAGLLKVIIGALAFLICAMMVLLRGLLRTILSAEHSVVDQMVGGLAESSAEYAFLESYSYNQKIDYILDTTTNFGLVVGLIAAIWVIVAILLFIHCKKISKGDVRKKQSIIYTVISWVISPLAISTILTTIATALRRRKNSSEKIEIEAYQE